MAEEQIPFPDFHVNARQRCASSATSVPTQHFSAAFLSEIRCSFNQRSFCSHHCSFHHYQPQSFVVASQVSLFIFPAGSKAFVKVEKKKRKKSDVRAGRHCDAGINMDLCLWAQTTNTHCVLLLCSRFARRLNGAARRAVRPWETRHMKAVVPTPRKFCWHLITKKEGQRKKRKPGPSPQRSPRVILRERNLCDTDRIVYKGRRCACAHQTHWTPPTFFHRGFFSEASGGDGCQAALCRRSTPLALMDLLESAVELMGKLTPSK